MGDPAARLRFRVGTRPEPVARVRVLRGRGVPAPGPRPAPPAVMRGMAGGRELVASIRDVLLSEGLRGLGVRLLAKTVYRRLVVMHLSLDALIPETTPGLPVVIARLREPDVEEYLRFRPHADAVEVRSRMAAGARCFVARYQGRIVHAGWAAADKARIDYLGCDMPLREGDVYQFDSYTALGFRGKGIARARVAAMARALHREGYRRLVACVLPENASAFGPLEPVGYRAVGRIGVVRLGRWRRVRLRLRPDARSW